MTKKQAIQLFNDRKIKEESVIRKRENIISGKGPEEQKEFDKGRPEEPKGFYEGRMAELKEEEGRTGKKSNILVFCKLALFCVTAAFIWISVKNGWEAWSIAAAGLSAAAYLAALKKDEGYRKRLDRLRAMVRTCENELAYLENLCRELTGEKQTGSTVPSRDLKNHEYLFLHFPDILGATDPGISFYKRLKINRF